MHALRYLHAAPENIAAEKTGELPAGMSPAGMAFLLVTIAGLCAPLGACVVLFINTEKHVRMLPGGLALAAGVMILVSLFEVHSRPSYELFAQGALTKAVPAHYF